MNKQKAIYLDPEQPLEVRLQDLMARMTIEEKVRQLSMVKSSSFLDKKNVFSIQLAQEVFQKIGIGSLEDPRLLPQKSAKILNTIQKYLVTQTRLGIPALIYAECVHGHMSKGATVFPHAIGLASTWNTNLVQKVATTIAKEARSVGVSIGTGPVLDLARDPRWGRMEETYGEDPFLISHLGVAFVKGLQGKGKTIDGEHVASMLKHFVAFGIPSGGLTMSPASVGLRELRDTYLSPFEAAVTEGGALSVMPAYNDIDGVPCSMSEMLLKKILRDEWGFKGYTFSDYSAIKMLVDIHHTAANYVEAGKKAFEAGMDMEGPRIETFGKKLLNLVKKGQVSAKLIDESVSRILRVKFLVGLFENPYADVKKVIEVVNCGQHRKLARQAAQETIVLLKNKGDVLPLKTNINSIAVIGPNADIAELGNYCIPKEAVSPLEGIKNAVSKKTRVLYAKGCGIHELSKNGFAKAQEIAEKSAVAIVVVGEASMTNDGFGWVMIGKATRPCTCGEGIDRTELNLPGVQQDLVEVVVATGTPTVVVLINGRSNSISWIAENVPAILEAWYPGEEGGNALADIIFGKVNPCGKLPVCIPRSVGQVPIFYNYKPSARGYAKEPGVPGKPGRDYVFMDSSPLFDFGYGLSYTKFRYLNLRIRPSKVTPEGKVNISVDIRNAGKRKGKEVVQLYINDVVSSTATPVKALKGFKKIELKPGEIKTVDFILTSKELSLLDINMERIVERGVFKVMIGSLKGHFEVK